MKKKLHYLIIVYTVLLTISFISCSNPNSSSIETSTPEWTDVSDKSDLIGSWKAEFHSDGIHDTNTIYVGSNYAGFLKMELDYSEATPDYQNSIPTVVNYLQSNGYSCTNDSVNKKLTAIFNFFSSNLDLFITKSNMKINSSKTKIKMTSDGKTAEYSKQ